jgi:hypothetical protein
VQCGVGCGVVFLYPLLPNHTHGCTVECVKSLMHLNYNHAVASSLYVLRTLTSQKLRFERDVRSPHTCAFIATAVSLLTCVLIVTSSSPHTRVFVATAVSPLTVSPLTCVLITQPLIRRHVRRWLKCAGPFRWSQWATFASTGQTAKPSSPVSFRQPRTSFTCIT